MKSLVCYLLVVTLALVATFQAKKWNNHDVIIWDMAGYYQYLSSYFIYDDVGDGSYTAVTREHYRPDIDSHYGLVPAPNGQKVIKYTMGLSLFYAPGFFIAHTIAQLHGSPADGYSSLYQKSLALVCLTYAIFGLWILRKVLGRFFEDTTIALTILAIGLATNFLNYATYESPTSHGTLFMLNAGLLLITRQWLTAFRWRDAVLIGIIIGLGGLVRVTELWMLLIPTLWGLTSWNALQERRRQLWRCRNQILVIALLIVSIMSLQTWFWHSVGGAWFIDSYPGERFNFRKPHVLLGLFSARKGWLIYTPIMALALLGVFLLRRRVKDAVPVVLVMLPLVLYVTFSWEEWWYGGGFSARPLISIYPLLALPLASFFDWCRRSNVLLRSAALVLLLCIILNLMQTWQYHLGILHWDSTTWEMYKERFFWLNWPI